MGASISLDSKYRLILNTEVECISINASSSGAPTGGSSGGNKKKHHKKRSHSESDDSGSEHSGDDNHSGSSESGSGSGSDSDSDSEDDKTYTIKITPEIIGYIRSYIRKNQFLDEFDLITEIELDKYDHAPGSALVFNSDSIVFMTNNQSLEAVGDWEYIESDKPVVPATKSKSKGGRGRGRDRDRDRDNDDEDDDNNDRPSQYKTKDDDLPVNEIENIITEKFQEYNKTREFVIHESKNSFLVLLIKSAELVKA
jgi:hypothetical protein